MTRHVALLRAINVGGNARISMQDLRQAAEHAGFADCVTILQSGSLIGSADGSGPDLERRLEGALNDRLGLATQVMICSAKDWRAWVAGNPFAQMAARDPSHLLLVALKGRPKHDALADLRAAIDGPEEVALAEGVAYVTYPDGIGRSKLTLARIERCLGTWGTGRNWSTVLKILAQLEAS